MEISDAWETGSIRSAKKPRKIEAGASFGIRGKTPRLAKPFPKSARRCDIMTLLP